MSKPNLNLISGSHNQSQLSICIEGGLCPEVKYVW